MDGNRLGLWSARSTIASVKVVFVIPCTIE